MMMFSLEDQYSFDSGRIPYSLQWLDDGNQPYLPRKDARLLVAGFSDGIVTGYRVLID
jgi:hypothetical protein